MLHMSLRAAGVLLLVLTAGCESTLPSFYTVPVRQGNYIDQAMVAQLRPGMTKQQVQRILGTPLVADPFHQNRWDYYYQYGKGGKIAEQRRVTVFFTGDTLERIDDRLDSAAN
jgi:outer membrane protein assembly factor BamE